MKLFSLCRSPRPQRSHFHTVMFESSLSSLTDALLHDWAPMPWNYVFICRSPRPQRPHFPPTAIPPTHRLPPKYFLSPLRLNLRTFIHSCLDRISVCLQMDYCITGADAHLHFNFFKHIRATFLYILSYLRIRSIVKTFRPMFCRVLPALCTFPNSPSLHFNYSFASPASKRSFPGSVVRHP